MCIRDRYENVLPIWGVQRERELDEFISYIEHPPVMTEEIAAVIEHDRKELSGEFCRGCGYCMPCPAGIEINNLSLIHIYLELYCILHFIVTGNLFSALCASLILRFF